jgi:hypothetical protein
VSTTTNLSLVKPDTGDTGWGTTMNNNLDTLDSSIAARALVAYVAKSANYTLTTADRFCNVDASGGAVTITLPTAVGCAGREYRVKKIDASANAVTVATTSSQTIDGSATLAITTRYTTLAVYSDGANWSIT